MEVDPVPPNVRVFVLTLTPSFYSHRVDGRTVTIRFAESNEIIGMNANKIILVFLLPNFLPSFWNRLNPKSFQQESNKENDLRFHRQLLPITVFHS